MASCKSAFYHNRKGKGFWAVSFSEIQIPLAVSLPLSVFILQYYSKHTSKFYRKVKLEWDMQNASQKNAGRAEFVTARDRKKI